MAAIQKRINEVIVFTNGDSRKISTWSNVPFFFTETLISKEIVVNRVNISPNPLLQKFYNITFLKIAKLFFRNTTFGYFRSYIHFKIVRNKIKKAIKQYPNAEALIFLTFSFSATGLTTKPIIQFGDWTYGHYFKHLAKRQPDILEKQSIKREDAQVNGSDLILALFPKVAEYMKSRYSNKNIYYLGNVINSSLSASMHELLEIKKQSQNIIFIGSIKYLKGVRSLISAFDILKSKYPSLSLHIIGINKSHLKNLAKDIHCYGYLDKGKDSERELYYQLLNEAKLFVNPTPGWGAFSASVEAMYFYTPVVVAPYDEFVETFGKEMKAGVYCRDDSKSSLAEAIEQIIDDKHYEQICINSHNAVKDFTWDSYIDKVIVKMEEF